NWPGDDSVLDGRLCVNQSYGRDVLCRRAVRRVMDLKEQVRSGRDLSAEPRPEDSRILSGREANEQLALQTRRRARLLDKDDHVMNDSMGAAANFRRGNPAIFFEVCGHGQILVIDNAIRR